MIKVDKLSKSFRTEEVETIALNSVSFEVENGEFVAIMGRWDAANQHSSTFLGCSTIPQTANMSWATRWCQI